MTYSFSSNTLFCRVPYAAARCTKLALEQSQSALSAISYELLLTGLMSSSCVLFRVPLFRQLE